MKPWLCLDRAEIPGGGGELRLMQRGHEFSIMSGGNELMNSRVSGSEEALAILSCRRLRDHASARILIGGLGMGFTLRAALGELGPEARIVVAELVPAVVAWARGHLASVFKASLADPRVKVWEGDVGRFIRSHPATYDAILLDVDNGPTALSREANDDLYDLAGLKTARRALRPGGTLSIWSSAPNRRFAERLPRAGFAVEEIRVRANGAGAGALHIIWIATRIERSVQAPKGAVQASFEVKRKEWAPKPGAGELYRGPPKG